MNGPIDDYLDRLLAPKSIDLCWVTAILHQHIPGCTQYDHGVLAKELAIRDGYHWVYQCPYE